MKYYEEALSLINSYNNYNDFFSFYFELSELLKTNHTLFFLYSAASIAIINEGYYSIVLMNIFLSCVSTYLYAKVFTHLFVSGDKGFKFFFCLLALHPTLITWSSVIALKEVLVLLLSGGYFYLTIIIIRSKATWERLFYLIIIFFILYLMLDLRFYLVFIFLAATYFGFSKYKLKGWNLLYLLLIAGIAIFISLSFIPRAENAFSLFLKNFSNPLLGLPRFLLTPLPFSIEFDYSFILFDSILHWLSFPLILVGFTIFLLDAKSKEVLFFTSFFFALILVYSMFETLQGPRHRVQIYPLFLFFQIKGVVWIAKSLGFVRAFK
ncbi:hypothetical protein [Pseudoalteromonas sp. A601]|uniref:hypothetical protein n=1 Tax=Pseudoalteromonas sp. A601 TaxID=1967839 RepID=UPI001121C47B|nr:hypothetical protein [Pseudoalteromonas sp. A601]